MSKTYKNKEEFFAAYKQFHETHPDAPVAEGIECLNLIMKREYAEQILRGEKPLEFRNYSDFYQKRLIDKDAHEYLVAHKDDEEVMQFCDDIRQVKKIHFHNYNNSWFLDVECKYNDLFSVTKEEVEMLHDKFGVHDFDDDLEFYEKNHIRQRPYIFYFVIGEVLDTNLTAEFCGGETRNFPVLENKIRNMENMEIIKLTVRHETFESIVNGLEVYSREIRPETQERYCDMDDDGYVKDIDGVLQPRKYDAIKFVCLGESYICRIKEARIELFEDEKGELITYTENGEEYIAAQIVYVLGEEIMQN